MTAYPSNVSHGRDLSIDIARGIAISLVVLAHLNRGLFAAGILDPDGWAGKVDLWLYSFFIPLFVFLSGLFIVRSVQRQGTKRYLLARVSELLWLYLVWSLINGLLQVFLDRYTSGTTNLSMVFALWWPQGTMWFLPSLAFALVVVAIAAPWKSKLRASIVLLALLIVALTTWTAFTSWPLEWLNPGLSFFLALGAVIGHSRVTQAISAAKIWQLAAVVVATLALMLGLLAAGAGVPTAAIQTPDSLPSRMLGVTCAIIGVAMTVAFSGLIARSLPWLGGPFGLLGQRSLPIYVSHTIFTAGARTLLVALGVSWVPAFELLGLTAGLIGPLLLYVVSQRLKFTWLFVMPTLRSSKSFGGVDASK